jgi:N-acetylglucosaminyl-diphospho-decaprenol L-rhamnosyltransferase
MTAPDPTASTPGVSVVIATWNTRDLVCGALAALEQARCHVPVEVIVIDNGSHDGSAAAIRERFPTAILICNAANTGYAHANNQGIALARGRYILLLGSDTVVRPDTLEVMASFLDVRPYVTAVACRLVNPDGSPQMSCRRFPRLRDAVATYLSLHRLARRYTMAGFDYGATQEVDQPAATCLLFRSEALHALNGFDESYRILYNDVDLCKRLRDAGGRIFYTGETEVLHYGSMTTRSAPAGVRMEMYRNILLYFRRNRGRFAHWVLAPLLSMRLFAVIRSVRAFSLLRIPREEARIS